MAVLDAEIQRQHQARNQRHTILLLAGLAVLVAVPAVLISGWSGLIVAAIALVIMAAIKPMMPIGAIMRAYRAREIDPRSGVGLMRMTRELARRAGLPAVPRIFVIPSRTLNAFATGSPDNSAIALTDALIRQLDGRELAGVVAHEMSHIRNNDLWVMGLADIMSRFTLAMSYTGLFLAAANVIAWFSGAPTHIPWLAILVLYLSPAISSLMQLALSRAREYDADLEGALLTGDPGGLARALRKIETITGRFWEDLTLPMPGRRVPQPSLLRTHPSVDERISRLATLVKAPETKPIAVALDLPADLMHLLPGAGHPPRYRFPAVWF